MTLTTNDIIVLLIFSPFAVYMLAFLGANLIVLAVTLFRVARWWLKLGSEGSAMTSFDFRKAPDRTHYASQYRVDQLRAMLAAAEERQTRPPTMEAALAYMIQELQAAIALVDGGGAAAKTS